jgi:hypothetical protein
MSEVLQDTPDLPTINTLTSSIFAVYLLMKVTDVVTSVSSCLTLDFNVESAEEVVPIYLSS